MRLILPSKRTRQPAFGGQLRPGAVVNPLLLYVGSVDSLDLVSGLRFTRGSALVNRGTLNGVGALQNANNTGLHLSSRPVPSLTSYVIVWSGVFLGAPSGSTPKIMGISDTSTSQSIDVMGLELSSSTELQVTFKSLTTHSNRQFAGAVPAYNVPATIVAVYDSQVGEVRLHVCQNGTLASYSSTVTSPAAPTIDGTEVYCVGPDLVEAPSRFCNVNTTLALIAQSVGGLAAEREIARNPWQLFAQQPLLQVAVSAAGGDVSVALTGASATAAAGTLAPSSSVAATGQAATSQQGTLTASRTVALSGQSASAAAGTVAPEIAKALTGSSMTSAAGSLTQSRTVTLSGQQAAAQPGSLTATGGTVIAAPGEYGATIMRASIISKETTALLDRIAAQAGTMSATLNKATIMRAASINAEGTMRADAINKVGELL